MDSFLEEKGCNEKMFQKSVMLSPILIAKKKKRKKLTTLYLRLECCKEANIPPHGRFLGYNWYCQFVLFMNTLRKSTINILFIFQVLC